MNLNKKCPNCTTPLKTTNVTRVGLQDTLKGQLLLANCNHCKTTTVIARSYKNLSILELTAYLTKLSEEFNHEKIKKNQN